MKKLLLMLPILLCLVSCDNAEKRTPLGWCLWEIQKHEEYNYGWSYIYNEIKNHDDSDNIYLNAYYITTFLDDRIGEWYCFVECRHYDFFKGIGASRYYTCDEVGAIDCDLVRESFL